MKRSSVQFNSMQRHTTSLLDDTDSTEEPVPSAILDVMTRLDDLRKSDPSSHELPRLNYDIQNRIYAHKRQTWRDFAETLDQKTDVTNVWRTIKGIDGRAKPEAENEAITFNRSSFSSSKQLAARFNQQFNTSKLRRHTSSSVSRLVTRETMRKSLEMAQTFQPLSHGLSDSDGMEVFIDHPNTETLYNYCAISSYLHLITHIFTLMLIISRFISLTFSEIR